MGIYDIDANEYNKLLSEELKKIPEFKAPEWIHFVKSSPARDRPILEEDFWHKRAASIMRQIYVRGVLGVSRLRTRYGGRKDRGHKPPEFRRGSGKIIRLILQQAEAAGLLKKVKGKRSGRSLTTKGKELVEKTGKGGKEG
ncbi:40S ribosomal protein S19 [Candidatus Pacearchaeota archaeon]|nr:40S ribosomal protein S19 [Candidatus Pacearchaeota archaeon]